MTDSEAMSLQLSGLRYKVKELSAENEKLRAALMVAAEQPCTIGPIIHGDTNCPAVWKKKCLSCLAREALK